METKMLISINGGGVKYSLNKGITTSDCKKGGRI